MQDFTVDQVVNGSARVSVKSVSGPIKVAGAYGFTLADRRRDEHLGHDAGGVARASSRRSGRSALPEDEAAPLLHAVRPDGLRLQPALPRLSDGRGQLGRQGRRAATSRSTASRARAKILGVQTVKVPAGTFQALAVRTTLTQPGFQFGSGTRTSWFAPGKGLVKLVFRHGDGSVHASSCSSSAMTRRLAAAVGDRRRARRAGCGGGDDSSAESVAQYIEDVNAIQHDLSLPLGRGCAGNRELRQRLEARRRCSRSSRSSATTIRKLERRLDALEPPPEAMRLDAADPPARPRRGASSRTSSRCSRRTCTTRRRC